MTDPAELANWLGDYFDLTECEHGFRLYDGHTCPNEDCERQQFGLIRDALLDQLATTMSAEEVREAALEFIQQVQSELLSQDAILRKFNLDKLGRLLELLGQPAPCR